MIDTQYAVIEWSPDIIRAFDPATRQLVTEKTVSEALRRIGNPQIVGLCLSRRSAFIRETRLPDIEKDQARSILLLRIDEMFPSVSDGVSFDFVMGSHRYDDGRQTTITAVSTNILRSALKDINDAGAKVAWTAPVALGAIVSGHSLSPRPFAVVESDGEFLNIDVVRHDSLIFSRSVLDPGDAHARNGEVIRTLAACGVTDATPIAIHGTDLGSGALTTQQGSLAAMVNHDPASLNMMTPEAVEKLKRAGTNVKNRLALILWLAVVCVGSLVWLDRMDASDAISAMSTKNQEKRTKAQDKFDLIKKALMSNQTKSERIMLAFDPAQPPSEMLKVLSNYIPAGAWLTGVTFERGKPVQIRGTTVRSSAVSEYTASLALDSRFRDVKLIFANNSEIETTPVVQFAITAHVVGNLPLDDKDIKRLAK